MKFKSNNINKAIAVLFYSQRSTLSSLRKHKTKKFYIKNYWSIALIWLYCVKCKASIMEDILN